MSDDDPTIFFLSFFVLFDRQDPRTTNTYTPKKSTSRPPSPPLSLSLSLSLSLFFSFLFFSFLPPRESKSDARSCGGARRRTSTKREIFVIFVRNDFSQERGKRSVEEARIKTTTIERRRRRRRTRCSRSW